MIQEICKNELFLAQKAEPATEADLPVSTDLLDTLQAHKQECVGMAANMIGINKRIIAFDNELSLIHILSLKQVGRRGLFFLYGTHL